jgi:hypothetical protein
VKPDRRPAVPSPRRNDEIWHLVSYDPVCYATLALRDNLGANYPSHIADAAVQLTELVFNETYDRIEGGPQHDVPELHNTGS